MRSSVLLHGQRVSKLLALYGQSPLTLAGRGPPSHPAGMFVVVSEAEAAAIRAAFEQRGEFASAIELRRLFPGVADNAQARECVRIIAGWKPLSVPLHPVSRRDPGMDR